MLPFIIVGVVSGSLYGLAAVGLVLTFKTSGIFNFAHGAIAAVAAYVFYALRVNHGLPWPLVLLICVGGVAPALGLAMELLARGLARGGTAQKVIATVGLQVGLTGFLLAKFGSQARNFPTFLPTKTFDLGSAHVTVGQLISIGIAVVGVAALTAFFRFTPLGIQMRAVVDDPSLLELSGTNARLVRRSAWMIGCGFAALSGILLAPTLGLDATLLTLLVVQAFGAAAIGYFGSLPVTYAGGLIVGVAAALATHYAASSAVLIGLSPSVPFIVLFVVLLVVPRRRLVEAGSAKPAPRGTPWFGVNTRRGACVAVIALAALVPYVVGTKLTIYTEAMVFVMVFQSLNLLVRTSGQVSLCQAGLVAVGAAAFSHLTVGAGVPWLLAIALTGLIAMPVGAIVAIPAIRLSGLFLALATLGFGLCLAQLFYPAGYMFGLSGSLAVPRPSGFGGDKAFYYLCGAFALATGLLIAVIDRSRLGRLLRAMADSPASLATLGLTVNITLVAVFCVSAFIAAVAGALYGGVVSQVSGIPFNPLTSLTWLAVLGISGRGRQSAAVIAAVLLEVMPAYINSETVTSYLPVAFGAGAVIAALYESVRRPADAGADVATMPSSSRLTARLRGRDVLVAGRARPAMSGGRT